ncbi:MAG: Flp family type IVb pilin [Alphaproteobacteria bacterium]|nr:MAG: Flp family type IVb pilin [Alphaproteobacteria bacterium]
MLAYIKTYLSDTRGATMIEYGLIAALVAVVLIVALTALGTGLGDMFNNVTDELG